MPSSGMGFCGATISRSNVTGWIALCVLFFVARPTLVHAECSRQWTPEASLNLARVAHGACVTPCGDIYVVGGDTGASKTRSVERLQYDGSTYATSWQTLADMPTPARSTHALACTNGFIYVMGGDNGTSPIANVDRYDILANTWSSLAVPPLSVARSAAAATTDRWGRIWVVGGDTGGTDITGVEIFDPGRPGLGWVAGPALNAPRAFHGLVLDEEGTIWALGGSHEGSHLSSIETIDACGAAAWTTSTSVIPNPASQTDHAVVGADGQIYVAGGWLPGMSNRVLRLDPMTGSWETCSVLSQSLNLVTLVLGLNKRVFRIGGAPGAGSSTASVESLDTAQFCAPSGSVPAVGGVGLLVMVVGMLAVGGVVLRKASQRKTAMI